MELLQFSLSKTIRRLEEDTGAPLFDRNKRRLRLNEFGALFLKLVVTAASTFPPLLSEYRRRMPKIQSAVKSFMSIRSSRRFLPNIRWRRSRCCH